MNKPIFTGLSHVCIFVDDVKEAFAYYERILGAIPFQHIPHWKNEGFFRAGRFIEEAFTYIKAQPTAHQNIPQA